MAAKENPPAPPDEVPSALPSAGPTGPLRIRYRAPLTSA